MHLNRTGDANAALVLNGVNLTLIAVAINGTALDASAFTVDEEHLIIPEVPDTFTLDISVEINPKINTALSGLYLSDGNYCTQCEPHGFRHMTYFFDRPDVMTQITTKIIADKEEFPVLLSNGNLVGSGQLDRARHWAQWEDPSLKPCYLFALVAGQFDVLEDQFKTRSGRMVNLKIYAKAGSLDRCVFAMSALKRSMRWDEEVFQREYDLDTFMIVAVDDFNFGAMENKGLNIFNSKYILADPSRATDMDFINVESVVAHEYFHNWSGNRVTLRDWFQISLKEGLTIFRDQNFTSDMRSPLIKRIQDVRTIRTAQFAEDAGPMAHAVRPEEYIEVNNFYTVTVYNKGAEVIRMLKTLIGKQAFDCGMQIYFNQNDGKACTIEDFIKAMREASGVDLEQFMRWYQQAGTPTLRFMINDDRRNHQLKLTIQQSYPRQNQSENKPLMIPIVVSILGQAGNAQHTTVAGEHVLSPSASEHVLILKEKEQTFTINQVVERPHVSVMRNFCAPVKVDIQQSHDELRFLALHDGDPFSRWDAGQRYMLSLLTDCFKKRIAGEAIALPMDATKLFKDLLGQESLPDDILAEMLVLPEKTYFIGQLESVDVDALCDVYHLFHTALGSQLYAEFYRHYLRCIHVSGYRFTTDHIGQRRLKNICLQYMIDSGRLEAPAVCSKQYFGADNMTDCMGALTAMNNHHCPERASALSTFYQRWQHDALVTDKWFSLQASAQLDGALAHVRGLLKHRAYQPQNPNRVRAVLTAFSAYNLRAFHALSGEGYALLAQEILRTDAFNPQLAARLAHPFTQWKCWDVPRQVSMQSQIEKMLKVSLSKNVFEVLSRASEA